jgi:hypothetical protein
MSKIALTPNASGTGTLTVAAPNTNTDRTLTLPDVTTTLVGTDATQTLTNKTLTAPIISGNLGDGSAGYGTAGQVLISGGTGANTSWASSQSIGIGQTWQDVIGSRAVSTSYQNLTGRPIVVSLTLDTTARSVQVSVNNSTWIDVALSSGSRTSMSFIVPSNWYYRINGTTTINVWAELR